MEKEIKKQDQKDQTQQVKGLTTREVESRISSGKVNNFKDPSSKTLLEILRTHFTNPSYVMTMAGVALLFVYQQYTDVVFIAGVIAVNIVISIIQELMARNSLRKITVINTEPVTVVRNGEQVKIMPNELVKDDVVVLESGKYIYVDGEVIHAQGLLMDESIITGESDYVSKHDGEDLLSGSFVISGKGYYRAEKVGMDSLVNKITIDAKKYVNHLSPLQKYINKIVVIMSWLTAASIGLLLFLNTKFLDMSEIEATNAAVAIISAMIPQGILLSITVAFMVGVYRMYQQRVLVQKASGVETLANIDVLCMDKTGTITQNKLVLEEQIELFDKKALEKGLAEDLIKVFCEFTVEKNKTLMAIAKKYPFPIDDNFIASVSVSQQLPFNSKNKLSGVEIVARGKKYRVVLSSIEMALSKLNNKVKAEEIRKLAYENAAKGLRNLVFIYKEIGHENGKWERVEEGEYEPLIFMSIKDELREGAGEILKDFIERKVKPIIISGDSAETIMALVKQLHTDILNKPITGTELAQITNETEFDEAVMGHDIFAAVTPEQKLQIIKTLQKFYNGVAMIGDGVNDALAIKQADLGISLGEGANVSRNISDIVLLDNDLRKLAEVIQEGKDIVYNTLRASKILTIKNFYSVIVIAGTLILNLPFPFSPRNVFLLSFINANFPTLDYLTDKNARYKGINFLRNLLSFVLIGGVVSGILTLGSIWYFQDKGYELGYIRALSVTLLVFMGLVNYVVIAFDSFNPLKFKFTPKKAGIFTANVVVYGLCFVAEPVRNFFELQKLDLQDVLVLVVISFIYYVMFGVFSKVINNLGK